MNSQTTALAVSLGTTAVGLTILLALAIRGLLKIIRSMHETNQTLTNLAASKDLAAFTAIQQVSLPESPASEFVAGDDESVANFMQEQYSKHGLNPGYAVDQESVDFAQEFGLGPEFRI